MKRIFIVMCSMYAVMLAWGQQPVDRMTIEKAAVNVHKLYFPQGKSVIKKVNTLSTEAEADLVHVVEYAQGGFAVLSGDWSVAPILGYSLTGAYDTLTMPPGLHYLIERYKYDMELVRQDTTVSLLKDEKARDPEWNELLNLTGGMQLRSTPQPKDTLIVTKWGQGGGKIIDGITFNHLCPPKSNGETGNCPAGCTAVAMAQVLNYWACRVNPTGSYSYERKGETLSADFGNAVYDWEDMIFKNFKGEAVYNAATSQNSQLIYHAGISCKMSYHNGWSYAPPGRARDALVKYWGMKPEADVKQRIAHLRKWDEMLRAEIQAGRPVIYSGVGTGGHTWVIDGYDSDKLFHCNWGWGGDCDGWYSVRKFAPYDEEAKEQKDNYSFWEMAIFNVEPVLSSGVGTPQFHSSGWTSNFDVEGEELEVDPVYGATHYEWSTDKGYIVSDDSNKAVLYTIEDATVRVRAYNSLCDVHSDYASVRVRLKNLPEIAESYASSGSNCREYYISNVPENADVDVAWTLDNTIDFTLSSMSGKYATVCSNNMEGKGRLKARVRLPRFEDIYLEREISVVPWHLGNNESIVCGEHTFWPSAVFPDTEYFKWTVSDNIEMLSGDNDTTLRVKIADEKRFGWVKLEVKQNGRVYSVTEDFEVLFPQSVTVRITDTWEEGGYWKALLHVEADPPGRYAYYDWSGVRRIKSGIYEMVGPCQIEVCMPDYENPYGDPKIEKWIDTLNIRPGVNDSLFRSGGGGLGEVIINRPSNVEVVPPLDDLDLPPMIPSFNPEYAVLTIPAGSEATVTCTLITPCRSLSGEVWYGQRVGHSASYNRAARAIQVDRPGAAETAGVGTAAYELRLYNDFGPVRTQPFDPAAERVLMPLDGLPDGSYYVQVVNGQGEVLYSQYVPAY